ASRRLRPHWTAPLTGPRKLTSPMAGSRGLPPASRILMPKWAVFSQRTSSSSPRHIPDRIIAAIVAHGRLREGPHGSMWAAHTDSGDTVTGWEERGPSWRGFATGGAKKLFRVGASDCARVCVTEAAVDA